jgi:hypothetical protein
MSLDEDRKLVVDTANKVAKKYGLTVLVSFVETTEDGSTMEDAFMFKWMEGGAPLAPTDARLETLGLEVFEALPDSWQEDTIVLTASDYQKFRENRIRKMVNNLLDQAPLKTWVLSYESRRMSAIYAQDAKALLALETMWEFMKEEAERRKK